MKAKLTFDLSDPDDSVEHLRCVNAGKLCATLWEMDNWLREKIRYDETAPEQVIEAYDTVRS